MAASRRRDGSGRRASGRSRRARPRGAPRAGCRSHRRGGPRRLASRLARHRAYPRGRTPTIPLRARARSAGEPRRHPGPVGRPAISGTPRRNRRLRCERGKVVRLVPARHRGRVVEVGTCTGRVRPALHAHPFVTRRRREPLAAVDAMAPRRLDRARQRTKGAASNGTARRRAAGRRVSQRTTLDGTDGLWAGAPRHASSAGGARLPRNGFVRLGGNGARELAEGRESPIDIVPSSRLPNPRRRPSWSACSDGRDG